MEAPARQAATKTPLHLHLRHRWRTGLWRFLWLAALAALCVADHRGWFYYPGSDSFRFDGRAATVVEVPDGNTILMAVPGPAGPLIRVRLLGTSAVGNGREARDQIRHQLLGREVRLRLPLAATRDDRGGLLAVVELPDGRALNEALLAAGLVRADLERDQPRLDEYVRLERVARHEHAGLWNRNRTLVTAMGVNE